MTGWITGGAASAQFLLFDRESPAYGRYAAAAGDRIKVGRGARVDGSLHANGRIDLKLESTVSGEVSAVADVTNRGRVFGRVVEGAAPVALPAMPSRAEARALATRVLPGPVTLSGERIDDTLFVAGAVRVEGSLTGMGTLIATGPIVIAPAPPAGFPGAGGPDASSETRLSILTWADLSLGPRSSLRGVVRARGRVMLGPGAVFTGSLIADGDVELGPGTRLAFDRFGDTVAPALTVLPPPEPLVLESPRFELTLLYADAAPGVDLASLSVVVNGIESNAGCSIGETVATCVAELESSGEQRVVAMIRDLDGNQATSVLSFTALLDTAPPAIAIESPDDGALLGHSSVSVTGLVADDGVVASVSVDGAIVAAAAGRFTREVVLPDGENAILVIARDTTGKKSERVVVVTVDTTPPRLTLLAPVASAGGGPVATNQASIVIAGEVTDEQGVAALEIAGAQAAHAGGVFEQEVALAEGRNAIHLAATDHAGNTTALDLEVDRFTVPVVAILSPEDGALVLDQTIDVMGTVDDAEAVVAVNGVPAIVSGTTFRLDGFPVGHGATLVNALATGSSGLVGAAGITVVRDTEAPTVIVRDPAPGSTVYIPTVTVAGMVNDVVVGTVNSAQVVVTVNGEAAEVVDRSFLLEAVELELGDNLIAVEAVDPSGNVGRHAITVRRDPTPGPMIVVASGAGQSARTGSTLPEPLVVIVRDALGGPAPGRIVTFAADGTDGGFEGGTRRQVAIESDASGRASVELTLGRRAGHHRVRASAVGFAGEAAFTARAIAGEPALLLADSGDQQVGTAGQELRAPFAVVVTDQGFNRLEGVAIQFEVVEGEGRFENGESVADLRSDSDGRVTARLTLGAEEGVGNNVAQARILDGGSGAVVTFAASALAARDPASTSFSGVVLDNSDQPVPGATVTLEGSPLSTRTDASGFFRLAGAPVGTLHLRVDGSTVERPGVWTSLEFLVTTVAGRDNTMGRPIFVLPLETTNALAVDETTGGVLTLPDVPGFALEIEPGAVTFPGGRRDGAITVTTVHSDKVPMPPNFGQQPRFVITIQPGGARFDPPARVVFPNVDGLAPGQVTELYSFDHDLARFVSIGPGTVSADGTRIASDPGVGIAKAGWHAAGDPDRPATCHDCAECKRLSGGACVVDDSFTPQQNAPDDCKMEICVGGRAVSKPNEQETARQSTGNCYEERCDDPRLVLDLADEPAPRRCCGNAEFDAPMGRLAGIYEPEHECCVGDGLFVVSKGPPIGVALDLCPDREDVPEVPTSYDGCSGDFPADMYLHATGIYSGHRNNPTPGPGDGTGSFSAEGTVPDPPILPCDRHDDCYQTCDSRPGARDACDGEFREHMRSICFALEGVVLVSDPNEPDGTAEAMRSSVCLTFAEIYYLGVHTLGKDAFENGQREHCKCCR